MSEVGSSSSSAASETVRVVVKCRPMNQRERGLDAPDVIAIDGERARCSIASPHEPAAAEPKSFTFDGAYGPDATNEQVYADVAFPLVDGVTEGYNGTVFAYGQTGCGKTYTMQGGGTDRGVIPRAFDQIFDTVTASDSRTRYLIRASFVEIYNEEIRDLLGCDVRAKLELKERADGVVYVKDLSTHVVNDVAECQRVMDRGWTHRSTAATLMNATSSRSHSIFTIHVERCDDIEDNDGGSAAVRSPSATAKRSGKSNGSGGGTGRVRASKLNLVDLAGSERLSKTGATGDRQREAAKINLSLSALGNVISALVDARSTHVPYRDSKLTRLLQDSLGGNTKTLMIACVSPAADSYDESLSTLRYANRAKNIRNRPTINEDPKDATIRQYLAEIERLKAMLRGEMPMTGLDGLPSQLVSVEPAQALPPSQPLPPAEPTIIERIVHVEVPVVDEAQLAQRTDQVVADYEAKMRRLADELAEARAGHRRTADEMARLQAASAANERRLRDELTERAETESRALRDEYRREMQRVAGELDEVRASRDAIKAEAAALKQTFDDEMRRVEGSVPAERVDAERQRVVEEYEQRMCRVRDELEAVRSSRRQVDEEMARLQSGYEAQIGALQVAVIKATKASVEQPTDDTQLQPAGTVEGVSCDDVNSDTAPSGRGMTEQPAVPTTTTPDEPAAQRPSAEVADAPMAAARPIPLAAYRAAVDSARRRVEAGHDGAVSRLKAELETLRRARDGHAATVASTKLAYQQALEEAVRRLPPGASPLAESDRRAIKADFEVTLNGVKDEMDRLKEIRDIVIRQIDAQTSLRTAFDADVTSLDRLVDSASIDVEVAVERARSAGDKYEEQSRRLEMQTALEKESASVRMVEARYARSEGGVRQAVAAGKMSEQTADAKLAQLNARKSDELAHARRQAIQSTLTPVVEDLDQDDQSLATSSLSSQQQQQQRLSETLVRRRQMRESTAKSDSGGGATPARSAAAAAARQSSDEAARRLVELERAVIVGGRVRPPSSMSSSAGLSGTPSANERRRNEVRERLRRDKRNAEEKQRCLKQAQQQQQLQSTNTDDPIASKMQEGDASQQDGGLQSSSVGGAERPTTKTAKTIAALRSKNESLEREIRDLQSEFELDRIDYLDAIRKQDRSLRWYQAVVDKILPALRRDVNYVDLEKIRSQSEWDDLNETWIMPRFAVDRRLVLPPPTADGRATLSGPPGTCVPSASAASSLGGGCPTVDDYELRSEDRFIERLNENAQRDPAAAFFRPGARADQLLMMNAAFSNTVTWAEHLQQQQRQAPLVGVDWTAESRGGSSGSRTSSAGGGCQGSAAARYAAAPSGASAPPPTPAAAALLPRRQYSTSRSTPRPFS